MAELSAKAEKARHGFRMTILYFAIVEVFCIVVWALTGQGYFWPVWPAVGMVLGAIYAWWRVSKVK